MRSGRPQHGQRGHVGWQGTAFAFGTAVVAAVWAWTANAIDVIAGVRELDGTPRWVDTTPPEPLLLDGVDIRGLYEEELPSWGAAVANVARGSARQAEVEAFRELQYAAADLSLASILPPLREAALDPERHPQQLVQAVAEWNGTTDDASVPVWVHPWVRSNGAFYVKTYEVLHDGEVAVEGRGYRARFVARMDSLNVVEGRVGSVIDHEEGAIVLVDRLRALVADGLWPLMAADEDIHPDRPGLSRLFTDEIRAAVGLHLGPEAMGALRRTAMAREDIVRTVDVIRDRGARCSRFHVKRVSWYGFAPADIGLLRDFARRDSGLPCPSVRFDEVERFREDFRTIVSDAEAIDVAERLLAWAGRAVLVHEARHAADDDRMGGIDAWEQCAGCPEELVGRELHEASAYSASFADPISGVFAVFQACQVARDSDGVHARAASRVLDAIGTDICGQGPPADLTERAAMVERTWFAREPLVDLGEGLPDRLPLRSR